MFVYILHVLPHIVVDLQASGRKIASAMVNISQDTIDPEYSVQRDGIHSNLGYEAEGPEAKGQATN